MLDRLVLFGATGDLAGRFLFPALASLAAARALIESGLPQGSRIAVEKPFGESLASAVQLNALLANVPGGERAIFRVDHVLGMPLENVKAAYVESEGDITVIREKP
ncbi:MAG TPA: hypothetical protein VNA24_27275 [Hyalangium sp.]|jgi:glucose-6-phosphate 1-dehydrogenase|nr:hypothetical protein [Hyalangium sp.]